MLRNKSVQETKRVAVTLIDEHVSVRFFLARIALLSLSKYREMMDL